MFAHETPKLFGSRGYGIAGTAGYGLGMTAGIAALPKREDTTRTTSETGDERSAA